MCIMSKRMPSENQDWKCEAVQAREYRSIQESPLDSVIVEQVR